MVQPVTAIIADDEPHLREFLVEKLALLWPSLVVVDQCTNGLEAAEAIARLNPSIAFLDIKMPGQSGLEVAQGIRTTTRVVFVTAFDQYAIDAFENEAVDYLLKPVADERLLATIARLKRAVEQSSPLPDLAAMLTALQNSTQPTAPKHLRWIRASRGTVTFQIPIEDVLFFRSDDKYTVVQTKDAEHLIRSTLAELIQQLDPNLFWQIHRSTVVQTNRVKAATKDEMGNMKIQLDGHATALIVSRAYQAKFKAM